MIGATTSHRADVPIAAAFGQLILYLREFRGDHWLRWMVNARHLIDISRAYPGDDLYERPIALTISVCIHVTPCDTPLHDDRAAAVLREFEQRAQLQLGNFIPS